MKIVPKVINGMKLFLVEGWPGIHSELIQWNGKDGEEPREPEFMYVFKKELPVDGIIIDLGANIGYNTLSASKLIKEKNGKGRIYSIEPDSRNIELLERAVKENKCEDIVSIHRCAIYNKTGRKALHLSNQTNLNSLIKTENTIQTIEVETFTLEDFMSGKGYPNFIKMDVEGAEVEVLEGGMKLFENNFPCGILMETHQKMYTPQRNLSKQLKKLVENGFNIKTVMSAGVAIPDVFKKYKYYPSMIFNSGIFSRGLYNDISNEHAIEFASNIIYQKTSTGHISPKVVRSILIERK